MASIPCLKSESQCFPCAGDSSNPFANLSIEPFDLNIWLGINFGRTVNVTPNSWNADACVGFCESAISQLDADDCARRRALDCLGEPQPPFFPPDDPPPPEPPFSSNTFCNEEVTCQSGSNCYTLPACTVFSTSVADANAIAQSLCNSRVLDPALSSPCGGLPPEPPIEPLNCPAESGAAAPDSLEADAEVTWVAARTINDPLWTNDGTTMILNTFDLPPGEYKVHNLDGYVNEEDGVCPVGQSIRLIYPRLGDDEGAVVEYNKCSTGPFCGSPPSYENDMRINCEFDVALNPGGTRLNGTGKCYFYVFSEWITGSAVFVLGEPTVFSVVQVGGLIPQPRKVQISSYGSLVFADPAGAAGWNGAFNTRDFYTAVGLRWEAPAAGLFGGAQLEYTMSHPTSANGKGWMINIYSAGFILMWRGYKSVGSTSIGRYYKDSATAPIGPACLTCADSSDDQWFP